MGAGEYYLEELEEIICMEEERRRRQKLGLPTDNGALQDSVSELFSPKNSGYRKQTWLGIVETVFHYFLQNWWSWIDESWHF